MLADVVGFAVLAIVDVPVIKELALIASLGVGILVFTNLALLPIMLSFTGVSPRAASRSLKHETPVEGQPPQALVRLFEHFTGPRSARLAIAVAVAEQNGEVRSLGVIPNREDSVRKLVRKLGPVEEPRFCYEAGPTGYVLYWQLTRMGAKCEVVAPTLVPVKSGDRVKTVRMR